MRDFKQQFQTYSDELKSTRCPYSDAELDKEIRSVVWDITPNETTSISTKRRLWPVAAAIVAAIIIPFGIYTSKRSMPSEIALVEVDGQHVYFACNNGCSPEGTLQNFKDLIQ